jgi:hypothetical protein
MWVRDRGSDVKNSRSGILLIPEETHSFFKKLVGPILVQYQYVLIL